MHSPDTIVAIATPPGRGGIGIVRLSGPLALACATPLLELRTPLQPARARFTRILDLEASAEHGLALDEAVVTFFAAPHSYTAEDVVEIASHGAPVLLDYLLRATVARGARLAQPGEFTQRAFLAGRLDLTAAEAVNDLIHASTLHQARLAAAQLGGSLARAIAPHKQALVALIAQLEAEVDFVEDDLDLLPQAAVLTRIAAVDQPLAALAATHAYGRIVRTGFTLALVGRPNAGKSSLFNRLLERDRAIVTAQPGTTRDPIAETFSLAGIPVTLIDTAGLRAVPASEEAEAAGIARTRTHMAEADLILHVLDSTELDATELDATADLADPETQATAASIANRPHLTLLNKADLAPSAAYPGALPVSALTGLGIDTLRQAILHTLTAAIPSTESAIVTNLRQHTALTDTLAHLAAATAAARTNLSHEFLLLDLHNALQSLDSLTGATTPDDILHLIFSTFCIGK